MTAERLNQYGRQFQTKVLYSLLSDKKFLSEIFDVLSPEYFESPSHKWIIEKILDYFKKYHSNPTMEVLKLELKKLKNEVLQFAIKEDLREAYTTTQEDIEYVKEEFVNFCKNQRLKEALLTSVDLLQAGEYGDIRRLIDDALKAGSPKDIGHEYDKDIESRFRESERKIVPFPWKVFNDITDGGIGTGDLMLLFAPPGIGKSTVVCNMAAHAIKMGYKVVFYTLELSDNYVGKKIDSILTGIEVKKLKDCREEVEKAVSQIPGKIVIKEYSPKKASLDTIESHLSQLESTLSFKPDLIIIDYPDLLKVRKSRRDVKEEIDDVYTEIKGLAKELKIPIVCPSQINRMGSKDEIIEGDKVAGSYGKMMIADLSISLSRRRKDKLSGTGIFHIMKSRLGKDGMAYSAKIDLDRGYIDISEEEYQEDDNSSKNSHAGFEDEEITTIRKKFIRLND
jgi:replicative DNA helicase